MTSIESQNDTQQIAGDISELDLLDEERVRAFLEASPDFFDRHADLLMQIQLPHDAGGAISLVERKIRILNDTVAELRADREALVQLARDNAALHARVYGLALDLVSATNLESMCVVMTEGLMHDFNADAVSTWLLTPATQMPVCLPEDVLAVAPESPEGRLLTQWLPAGARCGRFPAETLRQLFTDTTVGSAVVLPFEAEQCSGLVAIGAHDPARFAEGLATDALEFLVATAAARFGTWLDLDAE